MLGTVMKLLGKANRDRVRPATTRSRLTLPVKRWLGGHGYTLAGNWQLREIVFARHLRDLFRAYNVDCVLDVGANEGQYARFLRQEVGYRGLILSFEPIRELAEVIEMQVAGDPRWKVQRLALGETSGSAEINITRQRDFSSFLKPTDKITGAFSEANQVVRTETVRVRTLRDLMPELRQECGFSKPYLKVDTQGYDLPVLRGAGQEITCFVAAQAELSFRRLYEDAPGWADVVAFLSANGFAVSEFSLVARDKNLCAIELDGVFVNTLSPGLPDQHANCP